MVSIQDYILRPSGSVLFPVIQKGINEETSGRVYWKMCMYRKQLLERKGRKMQPHDIHLQNDGRYVRSSIRVHSKHSKKGQTFY